ncbi:MAG: site-2 protease family protein [Thermoflexales bacterium]
MGGPLGTLLAGVAEGDWLRVLSSVSVIAALLLVALPLHELAHALTAKWLGDDTAERLGRVTLNPLAHLDVFGTLLVLLAGFGWAKPVPVNPYRLRTDPRTGMALVAIAGPLTNLLLAVAAALIFRLASGLNILEGYGPLGPFLGGWLGEMLFALVVFNTFLALFNLIPVPPLDGSRLLALVLPEQAQPMMEMLERYGFVILLLLFSFGGMSRLIATPANWLVRMLLFM